jgi:regulator of RNase E activity RraA
MLDSLKENSFVVWDTSNDDESTQWGECMTMAAQRKKVRGAAVDGGVRDTDKVLELGFPLWCATATPTACSAGSASAVGRRRSASATSLSSPAT